MGLTAENLVRKYEISRLEQDQLSVESHQKAFAAIEAGKFRDEIVPLKSKDRRTERQRKKRDERDRFRYRRKARVRKHRWRFWAPLQSGISCKRKLLQPVTPQQMSDGAAAVVVMSPSVRKALGLKTAGTSYRVRNRRLSIRTTWE